VSQRVAVLIVGEKAENGYPEMWSDTVLMRDMLLARGFLPEDILILYGPGAPFVPPAGSTQFDGNTHLAPAQSVRVDGPANWQSVQACFTSLGNPTTPGGRAVLGEGDLLFVWTFGHGLPEDVPGHGSRILLMGDEVTANQFSTAMAAVPAAVRRVIFAQQCYSGGFIEALRRDNSVIFTACNPDEEAYQAEPPVHHYPDGRECPHGKFDWHVIDEILRVNPPLRQLKDSVGAAVAAQGDPYRSSTRFFEGPAGLAGDPLTA
jgi:hypothetical protein